MPTEAQIIESLKRKRASCIESLARIRNFLSQIPDVATLEDVNVRIELLEKSLFYFKEHEDVLGNYNVPSEYATFEESYLDLKAKLRTEAAVRNNTKRDMETQMNDAINKLVDQQKSFLSSAHNSSMVGGSELRLPPLNIPKFTDNYQDFPEFRDLYEASVHNNEKLPTSHKFQYLKGLLKDEASALIKHIQLTDANYEEAWKKIVERYAKSGILSQHSSRNLHNKRLYRQRKEV